MTDRRISVGESLWVAAACGILAIICLAVLFAMNGCAGWQTKTKTAIAGIHEGAKLTSSVIEPILKEKCGNAAERCARVGDKTCTRLVECQNLRHKATAAIVALHLACLDGIALVDVLSEGEAAARLVRVVELYSAVRATVDEVQRWK